jgi:2-dehydropantoate 2-reductase
MTRVALIGPGAVGCVLGAWLDHTRRHELTLCARQPFSGLVVDTPEGRLSSTPRVVTRAGELLAVDWALVSTKTYDSAGAATWFAALGAETPVAILQNGVEHEARFTPFLPRARIVPVVVDIPAERSAPGLARQRGPGRLTVTDDAHGRAFAALFDGTKLELTLTSDLKTAAWKKLCLNSAGVLSALLLEPAVVLHDDAIAELARGLVRECIAVGRAEGAALADELADTVVEQYRGAPRDSVNSLHADRAAGRATENDARNGAIVRLGQRHRIATPYNQMAFVLLDRLEQTERKRAHASAP